MAKTKFKHNDIVARIYDSGRIAIGVYRNISHPEFIYLGPSFSRDSGLTQFGSYAFGDFFYKYRLATEKEILKTLKDVINSEFSTDRRIIELLNNYTNKIRKNKLDKLNNL